MTLPQQLQALRARCHSKDFHGGEMGISVISCIYCTDLPAVLTKLEACVEALHLVVGPNPDLENTIAKCEAALAPMAEG